MNIYVSEQINCSEITVVHRLTDSKKNYYLDKMTHFTHA